MMSQKLIEALRVKWLRLRLLRHLGSVMTDYRILQNHIKTLKGGRDDLSI